MDTQEFKTQITASNINEERKQKILSLLSGEITDDVMDQVSDIIQEDIESDTSIEFTEGDKIKMAEAKEKLIAGLSQVEQALSEDMDFVETEMNEMTDMVKELNKASEGIQIEELKTKLASESKIV